MCSVVILLLAGVFQLATGILDTMNIKSNETLAVVPNQCIITLSSGVHRKRSCSSPHSQFYDDLRSHAINWTIIQEYKSPILTGVVLQIDSTSNLTKFTHAACVESVSSVYLRPAPSPVPIRDPKIWKRQPRSMASWSHVMTGVDDFHVAGRFGRGIKIGIVDSGIDYHHQALGAGFGPEYKVIGGYDFVGDHYTGGLDGVQPQRSPYPLDRCNGHGTHVAGIIGANPNNPRRVVGVVPEASINAYRVFSCRGFSPDTIIIQGVLRAYEDGNHIIVMASTPFSGWDYSPLAATLKSVADAGRVVTVAVGNHGAFGSWYVSSSGESPGIIHVGSVGRTSPLARSPDRAIVETYSSYGPGYNMYLRPAISAPGEQILSTWPTNMGSYETLSGTSQAAPFVAGAVALWLQAKGVTDANAGAARAAFQTTAAPLLYSRQIPDLLDTVSHQGAGLIQVHHAVSTRSSMRPAELLLNDTLNARLVHTVKITNLEAFPITYTITHVPAGTINTKNGMEPVLGRVPPFSRSAVVTIRPETITVHPGSSNSIQVRFEPPNGLDPTAFPVYSGNIRATGSDRSTLQSSYLGLAAALKEMKVLDDTNAYNGVQLPYVMGRTRRPITGPTTFTMSRNDAPILIYRLVAGTPLFRLDLIDAGAGMTSQRRSSSGLSSSGRSSSGRSPFRIWLSRVTSFGRSPSSRSRRIGGNIFYEPYLTPHVQQPQQNRGRSSFGEQGTLVISRFADGRDIPDGDYRLWLRVLKITGDPGRETDYESWTSPQINIRRG